METKSNPAWAYHHRWILYAFCGLYMPHSHLVYSYQPLYHKTCLRFHNHNPTGAPTLVRSSPLLLHKRLVLLGPLQSSSSPNSPIQQQHHQQQQQRQQESENSLSLSTASSLSSSLSTDNQTQSAQSYPQKLAMTLREKLLFTLSATALLAALTTLILLSGPGAWRFYLAGGLCAAISHGITTPIDVVKTRQQVDHSLSSMGLIKSTLHIIHQDGIRTLLAGLGPTTIGYLLEGAMKFGIYEVTKPIITQLLAWTAASSWTFISLLQSKVFAYSIAGIIAGVVASVVICPMEAIRIRLVADSSLASQGWILAGFRMIQYEGSHGMWKGLPAMLWKQVPYTVTKNVSFDIITYMAYSTIKSFGYTICSQLTLLIPIIAAMATSVLSTFSSQPGDVLLSLVNSDEKHVRIRDIVKDIMNKDGIKGFFIGIRARLLHVGTIVTTQLILYDFVKRICGITATGL